jgi:hypothetical protein
VSDDKPREARLRRVAKRKGLVLQKSRRRDPRAVDYGRYFLVMPEYNALPGNQAFGLSLDDVERWLADCGS